MKPKTRFIAAVIEEASKSDVQMPWTRGARRSAFIAKRRAADKAPRRSA